MKAQNTMIVNLTPHAVDIHGDEGLIDSIPPTGAIARCAEERQPVRPVQVGGTMAGMYIPVTRATYGAVTGLPEPDGETIYIVSALVLAQCAGRDDVFAPGPAIRDAAGKVIGCYGLSAAAEEVKVALHDIMFAEWSAGANGGAPPSPADAAKMIGRVAL